MTHTLIKPHHLERSAYVYLRQSSPGQVRKNREGRQRQQAMVEHVAGLGWPQSRIILLDQDSGQSGSSQHGREDLHRLLEAIVTGKAGLVAARELSRLVRDNQDWTRLVRLCRFEDVLLADEHRLYNPADPQDRMVLGIQGAFNEFELSMIVDRMQQCLRQKAERGEQYDALPPGYICRHPPLCEKHPDPRVQRAVEKVLHDFERFSSARQLYLHLLDEMFQLPVVMHGRDWREVEWITPSYTQILELVRNPAYAGLYVRGRTKTIITLDSDGNKQTKRRRVPRDGVGRVPGRPSRRLHHAASLGAQRGEDRRQRQRPRSPGQRRSGARLQPDGRAAALPALRPSLAGTVFLRRRALRLLQAATDNGCAAPRAAWPFPAPGWSRCWWRRFSRWSDPRASKRRNAPQSGWRCAIKSNVSCSLIVCRPPSKLSSVPRANTSKPMPRTWQCGKRWEPNGRPRWPAWRRSSLRLTEFDQRQPTLPTAAQREQLARLGEDVRRLWNHPSASGNLKQQLARVLIVEIVADIDEERDEVLLLIHWSGGHHTELRQARASRRGRPTSAQLKPIIETLRKVLDDASIAAALNREQIRPADGQTWTRKRVRALPAPCRDRGL